MNYIAEINAFYDRLELDPQPNQAIALWHALMSIANKSRWPDTFTVASSVLGLRAGLSASALKRARNQLATSGLIKWKPRGGNLSASYQLVSLVGQYGLQSEPQCEPQTEQQIGLQSEPQSGPINKHKQKHISLSDRARGFLEFWSVYPKQINQQMACQSYISLLECTPALAEDVLLKAARNYAEACQIRRTQERFIKNPENWLSDGTWQDYVPEKYKRPVEPEKPRKTNQFNSFPQREYSQTDMQSMEQRLLNRNRGDSG